MAILVIADDLTGAAEIGGMALRYGLSATIVHTLTTSTREDVQILNTNTRSLKVDDALAYLEERFEGSQAAFSEKWDWIYLKFDSALRGHIKEEIEFYCRIFQKDNMIFCPVNPALGRVIREGVYWVEGQPIAETDFAQDPEFPIVKSEVLAAIAADSWSLVEDVSAVSAKDFPYIVAAVQDAEGLRHWASVEISFGIYAGAAAFFEALLRQRVKGRPIEKVSVSQPPIGVLYVCGSNHENSIKRVAAVDTEKVVYWSHIGKAEEVAKEISRKIEKHGKVVLAIAPTVSYDPQDVRKHIAQVLAIFCQGYALRELVIEGGATARAILEALAIDTLLPVWEYGQGVIRNRVPDTALMITLKPGSYPWTAELWVF